MSDCPQPRRFGAVNWLGLWTLYAKEVRRFLKVYTQTVLAPVVTTHVFLVIFTVALGRAVQVINGVPFIEFLAPGLIVMAMAQNSFANTSSSIMVGKIQGNIVDMLMPPLAPGELTFGLIAGGVTRGLAVGLATGLAMSLITGSTLAHPFIALFYGLSASLLMSLLGTLTGLWAEKFDQTSGVTNFVITPLAFLSGTFYSIDRLPPIFQAFAHANPFFYMIDGFRYGFIGVSDAPLWIGAQVLTVTNLLLWMLCWRLIATGYKLKA